MSSHWTDTMNIVSQYNVSLIRAQLQVKVYFTFYCIQFYHHTHVQKRLSKTLKVVQRIIIRQKSITVNII